MSRTIWIYMIWDIDQIEIFCGSRSIQSSLNTFQPSLSLNMTFFVWFWNLHFGNVFLDEFETTSTNNSHGGTFSFLFLSLVEDFFEVNLFGDPAWVIFPVLFHYVCKLFLEQFALLNHALDVTLIFFFRTRLFGLTSGIFIGYFLLIFLKIVLGQIPLEFLGVGDLEIFFLHLSQIASTLLSANAIKSFSTFMEMLARSGSYYSKISII